METLQSHLDSRNMELWEELNERFNITIEDSINKEYSCYSKDKDVIIYIPKNSISKGSFTHELLHAYLKLKGCYIGASLKAIISSSNILSSIYSYDLLEHMGNCLDHIKMLPIYLELGFEKKEFIVDYDVNKCLGSELTDLKKKYRTGKLLNIDAVDFYLGKLTSIMADPNGTFDYSSQLKTLNKMDPLLYAINVKMINHWKEIPLEKEEVWDDDYHTVVGEYYEGLKKWMSKNKFN